MTKKANAINERRTERIPGPVPAYQNVIAIARRKDVLSGYEKLKCSRMSFIPGAIATDSSASPYRKMTRSNTPGGATEWKLNVPTSTADFMASFNMSRLL